MFRPLCALHLDGRFSEYVNPSGALQRESLLEHRVQFGRPAGCEALAVLLAHLKMAVRPQSAAVIGNEQRLYVHFRGIQRCDACRG
ncbi:hypothetical protein EMIT0158MI4_110143 [Burkholderia ambifaria]